jgi:FKBP-type peptidyl-prolyl cis-trans isomerase
VILKNGIKLLEESEGDGKPAQKGDRVVYNLKIFLNKGDEIQLNRHQAELLPAEMIRTVDAYRFVDHRTTLGSREAIAGVEYSLFGMKKGGYRKVRVSPHLAYGENGLSGFVPRNAVLIIQIWLRDIISTSA